MKINRERIITTALALLDEVGLDNLSTRMLAERLAVKQPALYWHFKGRSALLEAMNARMLAERHDRLLPEAGESWSDYLWAYANSFRAALLSRRDGARLHAGSEAQPANLPTTEKQFAFMSSVGWSVPEAMDLFVAISRYSLGCVLEEQAPPDIRAKGELDISAANYPHVTKALSYYRQLGPEEAFASGLRLLLGGAKTRLALDSKANNSTPVRVGDDVRYMD